MLIIITFIIIIILVIVLVQIFFHTCLKKPQSPEKMNENQKTRRKKEKKQPRRDIVNPAKEENNQGTICARKEKRKKKREESQIIYCLGRKNKLINRPWRTQERLCRRRNKRRRLKNDFETETRPKKWASEKERKEGVHSIILLLIFLQWSRSRYPHTRASCLLPVSHITTNIHTVKKNKKSREKPTEMCLPSSPKEKLTRKVISKKRRNRSKILNEKMGKRWKVCCFWKTPTRRKMFVLLFVTSLVEEKLSAGFLKVLKLFHFPKISLLLRWMWIQWNIY